MILIDANLLLYGYDERSLTRVKRDPDDAAKLLLRPLPGRNEGGDAQGYLPRFAGRCGQAGATDAPCDDIRPQWSGQ